MGVSKLVFCIFCDLIFQKKFYLNFIFFLKFIQVITFQFSLRVYNYIVMMLEDEFGFEISIEDSEKFKMPRDTADYVIDHEGINEDHEF